MKNKVSLNSKVSLTEILLSVFIFAAAGIIMVNCFGIARATQIKANDKVLAGAIIQSDFEIIKSLNSVEEMYELLNDSYEDKNVINNNHIYTKYYDETWSLGDKEYVVTIMISEENTLSGNLININISAEKEKPYPFLKKGQEQIYSIESKKFFPSFGGKNE